MIRNRKVAQQREEWLKRQRAILPTDTIRNTANFEGFLIKGGSPLTTLQRVGSFIYGILFLSLAAFWLYLKVRGALSREPIFQDEGFVIGLIGEIAGWMITAVLGYAGLRILFNTFAAPRPK